MATIEVGCNLGKCQGMVRHHLKIIETRNSDNFVISLYCFCFSESACVNYSYNFILADEIVITTGSDGTYLNDTELIKIESNGNIIATPTNCKLPDYPMTLSDAKGTFLSQSNSYIICGGGKYWENMATNKCHQIDADSMSWNEVNPLKIGRMFHAITNIGQSLVTCGGWTASRQLLSSCGILENGNGQWTTMKHLPTKLAGHCMVEMDPSTIVSLGGNDGSGVRKNKI